MESEEATNEQRAEEAKTESPEGLRGEWMSRWVDGLVG